jgi:hypothetical protein
MRALTIGGFVGLGLAGVLTELRARRPEASWASLGELLGRMMRNRAARLTVLTAWWWLGWHILTP